MNFLSASGIFGASVEEGAGDCATAEVAIVNSAVVRARREVDFIEFWDLKIYYARLPPLQARNRCAHGNAICLVTAERALWRVRPVRPSAHLTAWSAPLSPMGECPPPSPATAHCGRRSRSDFLRSGNRFAEPRRRHPPSWPRRLGIRYALIEADLVAPWTPSMRTHAKVRR